MPATPDHLSLRDALAAIVGPDRVLDRPVDLIAFASDASFYRLIPKAIVFAGSVEEVRALFVLSRERRIPMTFRAAGTSLSGQAVTDGILVEVARNWRGIQVLDRGARVKVQPGVIGAHVNHALRPFRAKMGPDPASIATCTVGGILSNNSSGMCCGVVQNAYHTLESLTFVLPSGTVIDTAAPDADEAFRRAEPALAEGLLRLKAEIEANRPLAERIRAKYRMKNTTGYSLNAFIDFDRPVDIFRNLLVGSEGTLAFIAEAVLTSVPDLPVKVTGFLIFPDLHAACAAIVPLRDAGAAALELLDRASLRSVETQAGVPPGIKALPEGAAALLVEFQGADEGARADLERAALAAASGLKLLEPARFTHDPAEQALLWKIRSGTFPSVGAVRKRGTTVLIEDVAFPVEHLADAAVDLTRLFARHRYDEAILFGHAKDGNLHFVITQSFSDSREVERYAALIDDVVELVVKKYDGALKAEHGTGRNMAPFVEAEWGPEAKAVMERLKALVDPARLLNPGVILNADPHCHLADLKPMPGVEEEVDKCIECGYCEPRCPSRELTLTPRQRIVVRREMARLEASRENPLLLESLRGAFPYMGVETCAVDGLCATACPVGIDTGQLTKRFRRASHSRRAQKLALSVARHFATVEPAMRLALRTGHAVQSLFGPRAMPFVTRVMKAFGASHQWSPEMPKPAKAPLPRTAPEGAQAIYFPACISRMMGHLPGEPDELSLVEALVRVAERAGVPVHIPLDVEGTCCGVPFSSKGYDEAHRFTVNRAIEKFWAWSREGALPVVMDTSPCTHGMLTSRAYLTPENQAKFDRLKILDSTAFAHDVLLPRLQVTRKLGSVVLHPVCSVTKMNLLPRLEGVARACAEQVTVPRDAGCCGFAGDRGFTHPELTASATKHEAREVKAGHFDGAFASSRTCEVGLTRSTGEVYRSFLYLLESATRPEAAQ
ncbi:oxidoreductase [Geothrix rubra]|uniref:D-lactate dehydrogenase (cytochrome) n=1 Tax=Geothrix rubra TaxID=2927977 RepID=A0ABQ5Q2J9_9BACT|nr:FAD-binding and (Fe-S)-binding domain-containing protein [Geothrix rubra]GLH68980.1 oxidoreductase [Geothrix rubra]